MYEQFTPGRNIWKKVPHFLFLTMNRIAILVFMFVVTYLMIKQFYPYNIGWLGLVLIINNLIMTGFLILPSPSNPNGLMLQEIRRAIFKVDRAATANIYAVTKKRQQEVEDGY
ncbi:hypothetical protein [Leuconostoc citreum]